MRSGSPVTYTITVSNTGGLASAPAIVTDALPSGHGGPLTLPTSQGACVANAALQVNCRLGPIAPAATATVTITGRLTATATRLCNQARLTAGAVIKLSNSVCVQPIAPGGGDDLTITTNCVPAPVIQLETTTCTVVLTNCGPAPASIPAGAALIRFTITATAESVTPTVTTPPAGTTCATGVGGPNTTTVTCTTTAAFMLAAAATRTLVFTLTPAQVGVLGVISLADPDGTVFELNETNNNSTHTFNVTSNVDLTVSKTCTPSPITRNATITCTVVVTNSGLATANIPAGAVLISDLITAAGGASFAPAVTTTPANTTCLASGAGPVTVTCTAGAAFTIPAAGTRTLVYTGSSPAAGSISNPATADPNNVLAESNDGNNTATAGVTIAAPNTVLTVAGNMDGTEPFGSQPRAFAQGTSCPGSFVPDAYDLYTVTLIAGNATVTVTVGTLPSVLLAVFSGLYNPTNGCQNAIVSVTTFSPPAAISLTNLPAGTYRVLVSRFTSGDTGTYTVTVTQP